MMQEKRFGTDLIGQVDVPALRPNEAHIPETNSNPTAT
jgi:hypothetical protein